MTETCTGYRPGFFDNSPAIFSFFFCSMIFRHRILTITIPDNPVTSISHYGLITRFSKIWRYLHRLEAALRLQEVLNSRMIMAEECEYSTACYRISR